MSLYLKYRPKKIDELDLASVRAAFNKLISANNIPHAFLFTGPRGAGKTSSARILSRIVNCEKNRSKLGEPCNECDSCKSILKSSSLDFVEIDAASNRGIDDIRELKEKIRLSPTDLRYKIYIIDEVHMLTTEAFNALLKTLEEPPERAIFILCTTETHKVPETIVSRCTRIVFGKATPDEMKRSFARVVKGEGKDVSEDALNYLARSVDGSFRDGVKTLDTVLANHDVVDLKIMEEAVSGSAGFSITPLVEAVVNADTVAGIELIANAEQKGVDVVYLTVSLMRALRDQIIQTNNLELTPFVFKLDSIARNASSSPVPYILLELAIIERGVGKSTMNGDKPNMVGSKKKLDRLEISKTEVVEKVGLVTGDHVAVWSELTKNLQGDSITLGALLSKANPARLAGDVLTIQVGYDFHRDQIMSDKVLKKLEACLASVVGRSIRVHCEVVTAKISGKLQEKELEAESNGTIEDAIAIFS